jgi:hypothetical protein
LRGVGDVRGAARAIEPRGEARIAGHVAACVAGLAHFKTIFSLKADSSFALLKILTAFLNTRS